MQTPNANPNLIPSAVIFATPDAAAHLEDTSLQPASFAARKTALRAVIPPTEIVDMLTNTPPTSEAVAPFANDHDTVLRELRVGTMLAQSRMERGKLALEMCRLRTTFKASTGQELFPQERFDAYMRFADQCMSFPMGGDLGSFITAEALLGQNYAAMLDHVGDIPAASSTSEDEDEDETEDEMDEDEDEDGN